MTLQSPVKKIYITQIFGVNPQNYSQFGYLGHNGLDYRAFLPNGDRCYDGGKSEVFLPHDGTIKENVFNEGGYGWYIKIENDKEGSTIAHFSSQSPLKVGEYYKAGTFCGYQGTTGNSSGIHLHWGYYTHPRNKNNGYGGYINQEGLYKPFEESVIIPPVNQDAQNALSVLEATKAEFKHGNLEGTATAGRGAQKDLPALQATIKTLETVNTELSTEIIKKTTDLQTVGTENETLKRQIEKLNETLKPIFTKRIPQLLLELAYAFEG